MLAKLYTSSAGIHITFQSTETTVINTDSHIGEIINSIDNMCVVFDCLMKRLKTAQHHDKDVNTLAYTSDEKLRKLKEDLMLVQSHSDRNNEIHNRLLRAGNTTNSIVDNIKLEKKDIQVAEKKRYDELKPTITRDKKFEIPLHVVGDSTGSASLRSVKVTKPTKNIQ